MKEIRLVVFVILAISGYGPGCGQGLPDPTKIDGLRVLAIKVEPPELRGEGIQVARLSALAVLPGGLAPDGAWWYRCDDWDLNENSFMCPFNGGSKTSLGQGLELEYRVDPAVLFDAASSKASQLSGARKDDLNMILQLIGVWDTVNLGVAQGDQRVESFKRIVVSGPMAAKAAAMLSNVPGSEACADLGDDIPPNTNPELLELRYLDMETGEAGLLDDAGGVVLPPGRSVKIMPVVDFDEFEAYPQLEILGDSFRCKPAREFPIVSWFCESGSLSDANTSSSERADSAQLMNLAVVWNTPALDDVPEGGVVRCWAVLRDGRGGVDWKMFEVTVSE